MTKNINFLQGFLRKTELEKPLSIKVATLEINVNAPKAKKSLARILKAI